MIPYLLLLHLLQEYYSFLVLASLVLVPDSNDPWRESGHLNHLFLHEGIGPAVGSIAGPNRAQTSMFRTNFRESRQNVTQWNCSSVSNQAIIQ